MTPGRDERIVVACAAACWVGAFAGLHRIWPAAALVAVVAAATRRRAAAIVVALVAAGFLSGWLAADRREGTLGAILPEGPARLVVEVADDQQRGHPPMLVVRPQAIEIDGVLRHWSGPPLTMVAEEPTPPVGSRLLVSGTLTASPRLVRGDPVAGTLSGARIEEKAGPANPLLRIGNAVRERVLSTVGGEGDGRGLLAGFLVGDVSGMAEHDVEALRRAGLSHYVAVSGSNVALVLGGLWLALGPFRVGLRVRAALGLGAVAVFVIATRWEPSVLRAAVMAALLLGGGAAGLPLRPWTALCSAVVLLLSVSGQLAADVGFQLSVVATGGVLVGLGLFADRRPRLLWGALGAATGAQLAVTPLLLAHFGTVPLLSPLANLASGPLVTSATAIGAMAAITGSSALASMAAWAAAAVLELARAAAQWPQIGVGEASIVAAGAVIARSRRLRPWVVAALVAAIAAPVLGAHDPPAVPTATFFDIGQGDSVLIEDPSGLVMLVDGGREPALLADELRRRRIRRIDLLVVTHGDGDHVGGLVGILDTIGVGAVWIPDHPDLGPALASLVDEATMLGIPVTAPSPGHRVDLGAVEVQVIGPRRRYLSQNDGSVVLWLRARRSLLLAGDVEAVAQRELPELHPDVLLVPHHGSATTDLAWLARTAGSVAVVSVGENTYGHPSPAVLRVLAEAGSEIHITWDRGDVVVPLG